MMSEYLHRIQFSYSTNVKKENIFAGVTYCKNVVYNIFVKKYKQEQITFNGNETQIIKKKIVIFKNLHR